MSNLPARLLRLSRELRYAATSPALDIDAIDAGNGTAAKRHIEQRGWVLMRGVFSQSEIATFREHVLEASRTKRAGDLLTDPNLREVILNERYAKVVKSIVGQRPVYCGDSNWSADYYPGTIGFHKDNPDKELQSAPDWQTPYTIFRFGVYLQDCVNFSGGLCLRDRSHETVDVNTGQPFAVPSLPGDVVAWSHRTTHSGYATRLHSLPKVFLPLPVIARLAARGGHYQAPRALFRGLEHPDRLAVFSSFAQHDHHLDRYLRYLKTRQYYVQSIQASTWDQAARERAVVAGYELLDLSDELRRVDVSKLNRDHVPLSG